jgi:protein gp37
MMDRRYHRVEWGAGKPRSRTTTDYWKQAVRWNRKAQASGQRDRVFCASLADWLDDEVPIEWLADLLDLIAQTSHLDWLLLTKRIENWRDRLHEVVRHTHNGASTLASTWLDGNAPNNVWLGTTVEGQKQANERIPLLLETSAKVRFLSVEPLLEPIQIEPWLYALHPMPGYINGNAYGNSHSTNKIDWVICGGESGKDARTFDLHWARSLREQCQAAGVLFFFKQTGSNAIDSSQNHAVNRSLKDPKGGNITELPEELQVREIPLQSNTAKRVQLALKEVP